MKENAEADERPAVGIRRHLVWPCAAALALLSFIVHQRIERRLDALGILDQPDVLFDADPVAYVRAFAEGDALEARRIRHLNLRNTVHPLVSGLARTAVLVHLIPPEDSAREALRRDLALYVAPAAAGLTTAAVFLTFCVLEVGLGGAVLLALLELVSFSSLVFGSMPESYPLSGALLAASFLAAAVDVRGMARVPLLVWVLIGALAFGVTTTNLGLVAIPLFFARLSRLRSVGRSAATTAAVCLAAVLLGLLQFQVVNGFYGEQLGLRRLLTRGDPFVRPRVAETALGFPRALVDTFIPGTPTVVDNELGRRHNRRYQIMFTAEPPAEAWPWTALRSLLVAGLLAAGGVGLTQGPKLLRPLLFAALASLVFNWALHSFFWFTDLLLFSKHWHVALLILVAGCLWRGSGRSGRWALALMVALTAANSARVLGWVLNAAGR